MPLRDYTPPDLTALHAINIACEPGVGAISQDLLGRIITEGICRVTTDSNGNPQGFLLAFPAAANYAGKNFAWFTERYENFVYVDRIAIAPGSRDTGLGAALYADAFERFAKNAPMISCEVNTIPPNPASLRFHSRLGFQQVGTQSFSPGYAVTYLARHLAP